MEDGVRCFRPFAGDFVTAWEYHEGECPTPVAENRTGCFLSDESGTYFYSNDGLEKISEGDWIVETEFGELKVFSPYDFAVTFEKLK